MSNKNKIRSMVLKQRNTMTLDEVYQKSSIIQRKLEQHPLFQTAHSILFYVSFGHEVVTHDLLKKTLQSTKHVFVPRSNTNNTIQPIQIHNWVDLHKGSYGILEPGTKITSPSDIDKINLIIVPGVAFDINGNRLGHGKGYYDRLFEKTTAEKIGLAYEFQIINQVPTDKHDKAVDIIITEKRIIKP